MFGRLVQNGFHHAGSIRKPALHHVFFLESYLPGSCGQFWSFAIGEHLHILLPLLLFFMFRKSPVVDADPLGKLPLIFLLVAIINFGVRVIHAVLVQPYSRFTHLFLLTIAWIHCCLACRFPTGIVFTRIDSAAWLSTSPPQANLFRGRSRNLRVVKIGRGIDSNFYKGRLTSEGVPL